MISDDDFGPILEDLLRLYPAMTALHLRDGHRRSSNLAHGWYQRVRRSCLAIVALDQLGYDSEAAPIRRTVIEHTVALRWLARDGDAVMDVMALEHVARLKRLRTATTLANWASVDPDAMQAVIDDIDEQSWDRSREEMKYFSKQNPGQSELVFYLVEVGRVHATYQSAIDYADLERNAFRDRSDDETDNLKMTADFLLESTGLFHSMFEEPVWADALADLEARSRAANDRVRARRGLPPLDEDSA
ncbi:DUF5677 domain-containing protein [Nocardioides taihuensis]|uniref:DUF5677 domain-containing protein n=1 Tax=Nocardioides taihuensis TaxID=1835606 RepID=A0ABW0BQZ0_9ACTN